MAARALSAPALWASLASAAALVRVGSVGGSGAAGPSKEAAAANIPLIIWHGLGDSFDSDGMNGVADTYRDAYPNSAVYAVRVGDTGDADRQGSFFGNVTEQIAGVCAALQDAEELAGAGAANGVGFSQGGVFLRGLAERCDALPLRNLATFGSPHGGIDTFAACAEGDWWCQAWSGTLKSNTWGDFVQGHLVPAQYFRDPADLDAFLEHSNLLADMNNERAAKTAAYARRIAALDRFLMVAFEDEDVVRPPESTWFGQVNNTDGQKTALRDRDLYKEDWLGLRALDEKGGLLFARTTGKHMQIGDGVLDKVFREVFAVDERPSSSSSSSSSSMAGEALQAVLG